MLTTSPLDAVRDLRPWLLEQSPRIEVERRLPDDVHQVIRDLGLLRMQVPQHLGGLELDQPQIIEILIELARGDGSVGWTTMITSQAPLFVSPLPRARFESLFAEGPDLLAAGAIAPKGTARPVDGGYRVTGRWPFASGCDRARYLVGHCLVVDDAGAPVRGPGGRRELRMALFPAEEAAILDTWHSLGLRGTSSHDIAADDLFVPEEDCYALLGAEPAVDLPLYRIPIRAVTGPQLAAVAVGIAQGALDDLLSTAVERRRAMTPASRVAEDPIFQSDVGALMVRLHAARHALVGDARGLFSLALERVEVGPLVRATTRALAARTIAESVEVVQAAYRLAGSGALYDGAPMQRRLRDILTLAQHQVATPVTFPLLGALAIGEPVDLLQL